MRCASEDIAAAVPKPENVYACMKRAVTFLVLAGHEHWAVPWASLVYPWNK